MELFKCTLIFLSLSLLVLAVPKSAIDLESTKERVERAIHTGEPSSGLKTANKASPYKSNQETSITLTPKIVSTAVRIEKEPTVAIPVPGQCDPVRPHSPHPTNCYLFYHCVNRPNGVEQVEKTCNPPTMFNPNTMICDWPKSVIQIRPECGLSNIVTQAPVLPPTISSSAALEKASATPIPIKSAPLTKAICSPPCQNLGFCKAPGVCICPEIFEGPQCQFEKSKPCVDKPPTPKNSRIVCNSTACISTCSAGFAFPGGIKEIQLVCNSGNWVQLQQPQNGTVQKVGDCQPVCDPVCENGGRCFPNNVCVCPEEFRGPQCKYPLKNCAPERLNFNGGYNCSIGSALYRCSLKCGANGVFEFPPAPFYTCDFAKAKFTPEPVPQCISESQYAKNLKSKPTSSPQILIEQNSELKGNFQQSLNEETEWYHPTTINPSPSTSIRGPGRCDPARPHSPHPTNCYLFYHCVDGVKGIVYLEKTCHPPTMFNPDTMICDWPDSVMRIRPCGTIGPSTSAAATSVISTKETATRKPDTARSCVDGWTDWFTASTPAENTGDFELYEQIVPQGSICPTSQIREIEHQVRFRCNCGVDASLPLIKLPDSATTEKIVQVVTTPKPHVEKVVVTTTTTPATNKKILESCPKGYTWSRCAYICTRLCSTYDVELKRQGRCQTSNDLSCAPGCVEDDETLDRSCLWRDKYTCVPPTECIAAPTQQIVPKG